MTLFQVGFLANEPLGGSEPNNSHELASAQPVPVSGPVRLSKPCAGGWGFALAIAAGADQVFSWGVNSATILAKAGGNEDGADPATLDEVASGVTAAAAGFDHGLLVVDGKVLAFGPAFRPAGTAPGLYLMPMAFKVAVAQVAAGEHHSLALAVSGDVFAWGSNAEGQLGNGTTTASDAPLLVAGPSLGASDSELLQPLTSVACGARHSLAINAQGQCLAWGWSLHGQCGTGKAAPSVATPAVVQGLGPLKCTAVAGGMAHSLVCTDQGDVYAWGLNGDGQLGDGSDVSALKPQLLEDAALASEGVVKVAAGSRHSLLLCASGKAYACGWGSFGQLGTGRFASSRTPAAVAVPAGAKVVDVAAGWWHSLIVTE